MIYVTHDQTEAMTLADKIVVLRKGGIEQVGKPLELYEDPNNLFVAGFIGSPKMNSSPAARGRAAGAFRAGVDAPVPSTAPRWRRALPSLSGSAPNISTATRHRMRRSTCWSISSSIWGGTSFVHGHLPDGERIILERRDVGDLKSGGRSRRASGPGHADLRRRRPAPALIWSRAAGHCLSCPAARTPQFVVDTAFTKIEIR